MQRAEGLRHRVAQLGLQSELLARPVARRAEPPDLAGDVSAILRPRVGGRCAWRVVGAVFAPFRHECQASAKCPASGVSRDFDEMQSNQLWPSQPQPRPQHQPKSQLWPHSQPQSCQQPQPQACQQPYQPHAQEPLSGRRSLPIPDALEEALPAELDARDALSLEGALDEHLRGDSSVVGPWKPQRRVPAHPVEARHDVL